MVFKLSVILLIVFLAITGGGMDGKTLNFSASWEESFSRDTSSKGVLSREDSITLQKPFLYKESIDAQVAYFRNCHICHGVDRMGGSAPSLYRLNTRVDFNYFKKIIAEGRAQMPAFRLLDKATVVALYNYLSDRQVSDLPRKAH